MASKVSSLQRAHSLQDSESPEPDNQTDSTYNSENELPTPKRRCLDSKGDTTLSATQRTSQASQESVRSEVFVQNNFDRVKARRKIIGKRWTLVLSFEDQAAFKALHEKLDKLPMRSEIAQLPGNAMDLTGLHPTATPDFETITVASGQVDPKEASPSSPFRQENPIADASKPKISLITSSMTNGENPGVQQAEPAKYASEGSETLCGPESPFLACTSGTGNPQNSCTIIVLRNDRHRHSSPAGSESLSLSSSFSNANRNTCREEPLFSTAERLSRFVQDAQYISTTFQERGYRIRMLQRQNGSLRRKWKASEVVSCTLREDLDKARHTNGELDEKAIDVTNQLDECKREMEDDLRALEQLESEKELSIQKQKDLEDIHKCLQSQVDTVQQDFSSVQQRCKIQEATISDLHTQMDAKQQELDERHMSILDLQNDVNERKGSIDSQKREIRNLSAQATHLQQCLNDAKVTSQQQYQALQSEFNSLRHFSFQEAQRLNNVATQQPNNLINRDMRLSALEDLLAENQKKLDDKKAELENFQNASYQQVQSIEQTISEQANTLASKDRDISRLQADLTSMRTNHLSLEESHRLKNEALYKTSQIANLSKRLRDAEAQLTITRQDRANTDLLHQLLKVEQGKAAAAESEAASWEHRARTAEGKLEERARTMDERESTVRCLNSQDAQLEKERENAIAKTQQELSSLRSQNAQLEEQKERIIKNNEVQVRTLQSQIHNLEKERNDNPPSSTTSHQISQTSHRLDLIDLALAVVDRHRDPDPALSSSSRMDEARRILLEFVGEEVVDKIVGWKGFERRVARSRVR
ncbi:MAG: hypothetical protein Q9227_005046 [Pyrenula ochraceoflavens]